MAGRDLNGLGLDSLRHRSFEVRRNGAVLIRDQVPARFRLPRRGRHVSPESACRRRCLCGKQDVLFRRAEVLSEVVLHSGFGDLEESVCVRPGLSPHRRWLGARTERADGLPSIGCKSGDVYECGHLGIVTGLGDDDTAV